VGFEHLNNKCIKMARDMVYFLAVVNQVMKLCFDKSAALFLIADWIIDFLDKFGHILVGWLVDWFIDWLVGSQLLMLNLGSHTVNYLRKYNFRFQTSRYIYS
jgi:hypothetical protein